MAYDSRKLLHYFRMLPNGRFLFGGRGGTDASDHGDAAYRPLLTHAFNELFPGLGATSRSRITGAASSA